MAGLRIEKIEKARERLERALDRLGVAQRRLSERIDKLKKEPRRGGPEWNTLLATVEIGRKENEELVAREKRVRERLDGLIGQVASLVQSKTAEAAAPPAGRGDGVGGAVGEYTGTAQKGNP